MAAIRASVHRAVRKKRWKEGEDEGTGGWGKVDEGAKPHAHACSARSDATLPSPPPPSLLSVAHLTAVSLLLPRHLTISGDLIPGALAAITYVTLRFVRKIAFRECTAFGKSLTVATRAHALGVREYNRPVKTSFRRKWNTASRTLRPRQRGERRERRGGEKNDNIINII